MNCAFCHFLFPSVFIGMTLVPFLVWYTPFNGQNHWIWSLLLWSCGFKTNMKYNSGQDKANCYIIKYS